MRNIWKLLGALSVLGVVLQWGHAAQTCQRSDFQCFESGPSGNLSTPFRVDAAGDLTAAGTVATPANIVQGTVGSGSLIANTAPNSSLSIPILVSSPVAAGNVIVVGSVTGTNPTYVGAIPSTTGNATTVIGVADIAGSSGTVVNIDYSGLAVVLTTGAVAVGDLLTSSAAASGIAATNNSAAVGTVIGTALTTATAAASPVLTRVLLHH